jgi:hypothetical protein
VCFVCVSCTCQPCATVVSLGDRDGRVDWAEMHFVDTKHNTCVKSQSDEKKEYGRYVFKLDNLTDWFREHWYNTTRCVDNNWVVALRFEADDKVYWDLEQDRTNIRPDLEWIYRPIVDSDKIWESKEGELDEEGTGGGRSSWRNCSEMIRHYVKAGWTTFESWDNIVVTLMLLWYFFLLLHGTLSGGTWLDLNMDTLPL